MKKQKNWTHAEALKAGRVFRKHGVPCRVYQSQGWGDDDSYLVVYSEKDGENYDGRIGDARKDCDYLGIEAMYRYLIQECSPDQSQKQNKTMNEKTGKPLADQKGFTSEPIE